ncbi:MAG TPA: phage portal protein [Acidobacteriaceae bacterium]
MSVRANVRELWRRVSSISGGAAEVVLPRQTQMLPSVLNPYQAGQALLPKPTPENLRRFAETPVVRRAINLIKDRVAAMQWQVRVRAHCVMPADAAERMAALRRSLDEPNEADSLRTLLEQVLEDMLVGGFGAAEMELTGIAERPVALWPVDGASIRINPKWKGGNEEPRYAQLSVLQSPDRAVPLDDDQLMYIRMNPRTHTPFGLGPLEVAFETVNSLLSAQRFAGKLASNAVVQYALWLNEATPAEHDRLIRWWQDEIEGTGRVPVLSTEQKPEVLRFGSGTDADLRMEWQTFLIRMVANAFGLPPMLLGLENDVNRASSSEFGDEAFRGAIVPVARLLEQHVTRDVFWKRLGWREYEFRFTELESRDESTELQIQMELLKAGVLTVSEVRALRGLGAVQPAGIGMTEEVNKEDGENE